MRTVIDGAAQYEHGLIRARTRAVLAVKRARARRRRRTRHLAAVAACVATAAAASSTPPAGLGAALAATLAGVVDLGIAAELHVVVAGARGGRVCGGSAGKGPAAGGCTLGQALEGRQGRQLGLERDAIVAAAPRSEEVGPRGCSPPWPSPRRGSRGGGDGESRARRWLGLAGVAGAAASNRSLLRTVVARALAGARGATATQRASTLVSVQAVDGVAPSVRLGNPPDALPGVPVQMGTPEPASPPELPPPLVLLSELPLLEALPELSPELPPSPGTSHSPIPILCPDDEEDVASFVPASPPWLFEPELPHPATICPTGQPHDKTGCRRVHEATCCVSHETRPPRRRNAHASALPWRAAKSKRNTAGRMLAQRMPKICSEVSLEERGSMRHSFQESGDRPHGREDRHGQQL